MSQLHAMSLVGKFRVRCKIVFGFRRRRREWRVCVEARLGSQGEIAAVGLVGGKDQVGGGLLQHLARSQALRDLGLNFPPKHVTHQVFEYSIVCCESSLPLHWVAGAAK